MVAKFKIEDKVTNKVPERSKVPLFYLKQSHGTILKRTLTIMS